MTRSTSGASPPSTQSTTCGRWAAHHVTALAITCFPKQGVPFDILAEIMRGGLHVLKEQGVALLGGHSVDNQQIMFGYAVTGTIDPRRVLTNRGALPGDALVLTKPVGTGIVSTGIKFGQASEEVARGSLNTMLLAGREAARLMSEAGAHAATDVTGFALLGHAWEMARASRVTIDIEAARVPLIPGALALAAAGLLTSGDKSNRVYVGDDVTLGGAVSKELASILYDPQTAGGLLVSLPAERADALVAQLRETYRDAAVIGHVREHGTHSVVVK